MSSSSMNSRLPSFFLSSRIKPVHIIALILAVTTIIMLYQTVSWLRVAAFVGGVFHTQTTDATVSKAAAKIRMNQIQVVGTHNSYHREVSLQERAVFDQQVPDAQNYYYSHASLTDQLGHQSIRSIELDILVDTKGGLYADPLIRKLANFSAPSDPAMKKPGMKVLHVPDLDVGTSCSTLIECLEEIRRWSLAHPNHVPVPIDLELKTTEPLVQALGGVIGEPWNVDALDALDAEIRSVFPAKKLLVPDDLRKPGLSLEASVLKFGWPTLDGARGKVFFYMDNDPDDNDPSNPRNLYRANGHESLQGRVLFTNSVAGAADAAFIKYNDPTGSENQATIKKLVSKGYFVRTRADEPISTVLANNVTIREAAFASGAQIVSTDWPSYGMAARYNSDYLVQLPGGTVSRCNPVNAPSGCIASLLEK